MHRRRHGRRTRPARPAGRPAVRRGARPARTAGPDGAASSASTCRGPEWRRSSPQHLADSRRILRRTRPGTRPAPSGVGTQIAGLCRTAGSRASPQRAVGAATAGPAQRGSARRTGCAALAQRREHSTHRPVAATRTRSLAAVRAGRLASPSRIRRTQRAAVLTADDADRCAARRRSPAAFFPIGLQPLRAHRLHRRHRPAPRVRRSSSARPAPAETA